MADFNTHIFVAAGAASFSATVCAKLLGVPVPTALMLTIAGTIGGILPDIDLKYSVPSKILFSLLGIATALVWLFARLPDFTVLELWLIAVAVFLCVRFPLWALFHKFTVHRGTLHSLIAAGLFAVITATFSNHLLGIDAADSWMLAIFVTMGYLIHLTLDELYSVDFMGARIKRSFGSAFKVLDTQRLIPGCVVLFMTMVIWFWTPDTDALVERLQQVDVDWKSELLPDYIRQLELMKPNR